MGLVLIAEYLPLGYEVFAGNSNDVTTLEEVVELMDCTYGKRNRTRGVDRVIVSEDNLEFLLARGAHYLVGTPKSELKHHEEKGVDKIDWSLVREWRKSN